MIVNITWLLILPAIVSILIFKRPLISMRNYVVSMAVTVPAMGAVLFHQHAIREEFVDQSAIIKTTILTTIALGIFVVTIIFLDKYVKKDNLSELVVRMNDKLIHRWESIAISKIFGLLMLFYLLGIALLFTTFIKTGSIPVCNPDPSGKYFVGFDDTYILMRPFYAAGQQILAVVGLIVLLIMLTSTRPAKILSFLFFYTLVILTLMLTMKRGEIGFPIGVVLFGVILSRKAPKSIIVACIALMLVNIYLGFIADPSRGSRSFKKLCSLVSLQEVSEVAPKVSEVAPKVSEVAPKVSEVAPKTRRLLPNMDEVVLVMTNVFGIQIRETARLMYRFDETNTELFKGKTFIASILGFLPTAYFSFKDDYQIGRVTLRLFGINPTSSGGPRVGLVGEAYINFGYIGIFILPIITGIAFWYLDRMFLLIQSIENSRRGIFIASLYFFIINSTIVGFLGGGSASLQDFIKRSIVMVTIFAIAFMFPQKKG